MIHRAEYVGSYAQEGQCPKAARPEYAFIGRSNVGKSSLINMLTNRKELARTSKKPGKTQLINYFSIDDNWGLVDLPGYGYAKISKKMRLKWRRMIETYLSQRQQLQYAFVLIDSNVPPQEIDIEFVNWLGEIGVPFVLVFTKIDRPKEDQLDTNINAFKEALLVYWEELPLHFLTSSNTGSGRDEILHFIEKANADYHERIEFEH
ncbi:MAG: ribosome biogenesis GTP-binding protein YihA/YsxC [Bacteroidota bacterium]